MNERITKLYEQAIVLEGNGDYVAGELDTVKFAELIVIEVLNTICIEMDNHKVNFSNYPAWCRTMTATEKHFGVR